MMTWCNISRNNNNNPSSSSNNNNNNNNTNLITSNNNLNINNNNMKIPLINENSSSSSSYEDEDFINPSEITNNPLHTISCPSCGHHVPTHHDHHQAAGGFNDLPGLPAGVKFDPTDPEVLGHLEAKVNSDLGKLHPLLDQFIPTIKGENGICSTHPEKLPGVSKDGVMRHFFHCPSKAYTTGTRKRRKVSMDEDGAETRWHKTGKTRPVLVNGVVKGYKKILVLYTNFGRQRKPEKTNWVMHQYHLGEYEEETEGEYVLSKIFYQTQPRQCASNNLINTPPAESPLIRTTPLSFYHPHYMSTYDHGVTSQAIMALQGQGSRFVRLSGAGK